MDVVEKEVSGDSWAPGVRAGLRSALVRRWLAVGVCVALAASVAGMADPFLLHVATISLIYAIAAMGLQFVTGVAGQFSVGHIAFFGIGAYASAILSVRYSVPVIPSMAAGVVMAGIAGSTMAPITRLRGNYMAIATLAFLMIVHLVIRNEEQLTGGTHGLGGIPPLSVGGMTIAGADFYYLALASVCVTLYVLLRLAGPSRFGRTMTALRQNQTAAIAMGVNPTAYKVKAYIISAAIAGFAGVLFAHYVGYIHPNGVTLPIAVSLLTMIVIGGLGSLPGAIIGAFVVTMTPEYLRFLEDYRLILYGTIIVVLMIFLPQGVAGALRAAWIWLLERLRGVSGKVTKGGGHAWSSDG